MNEYLYVAFLGAWCYENIRMKAGISLVQIGQWRKIVSYISDEH